MKSHGTSFVPWWMQLVEGVLAVGARLAPHDRPGLAVRPASPSRSTLLAVALHVELLQVGGEAARGTGRRAGRRCVSAPRKSSYQMPSSPSSTGRLRSNGAVRKCSSIAWKPASISRKRVGPDRDHQRQADRRVERVAPADPVPELEHVGGVDAERRRPRSALVETATKCLATRRLVAAAPRRSQSRAECALVSVSSVRERLRADDEQRLGRVELARSPRRGRCRRRWRRSARQVALGVVAQRLVRHHRPEVRAADADVDDVADRACRCGPSSRRTRTRSRERRPSGRARRAPRARRSRRRPRSSASRGARSATCSTARSSVTLIFSPANIASIRSRRPASSASASRSASVSSVTRFLE